ncbi:MAG TPA: hypothetical protein VFW44_08760, partial [Bryobacteraceae bacterium]|nr:hypothetical protein [Bryobacteraceae bacterium]
ISTNATIRATHIGASGVALNKIAEVMQRLALESNANTEEVATALDGMTEAVGRIGAREGEAAKDNNAQDSNRIEQALAGLHSSRESSAARVDHVARTSSELAEEIAALRSRLSAGKLFGEVAGRARAQLESLEAEAGEHASDDAGAESTEAGMQHLQHLADSYTMQRQRDVHHSVVGTTQTPARMESQAPGDGELGDNVDLF